MADEQKLKSQRPSSRIVFTDIRLLLKCLKELRDFTTDTAKRQSVLKNISRTFSLSNLREKVNTWDKKVDSPHENSFSIPICPNLSRSVQNMSQLAEKKGFAAEKENLVFETIGDGCPICGGVHGGCSKGATNKPGGFYRIHCYDQNILNNTEKFDAVEEEYSDGKETFVRIGEGNGGSASAWIPKEFVKGDRSRIKVKERKELLGKYSGNSKTRSNKKRKKGALSEVKDLPETHTVELSEIQRWFERIRQYMGLDREAKEYLRGRGLTDAAIEAGKYFKYNSSELKEFGKKYKNQLPKSFPAWTSMLGFRLNSYPGIALPILDEHGNVNGCQIRHYRGDVRYSWWSKSSSGSPANISVSEKNPEYKELPISYNKPVEERKRPVFRKTDNYILLPEGILKPFIASQFHSVRSIGAAGGLHLSSPVQLKRYLDLAKSESPNPDKFLVILPLDAGDTRNKQVGNKAIKLAEWLENHGYDYKILWYGQRFKPETAYQKREKGDIDEISRKLNRLDKHLISLDSFKYLFSVEQTFKKKEEELITDKDALAYAQANKDWGVVEVNSRYLSNAFSWDKYPSGLVAVKSPMNSGKTQSLEQLVTINKKGVEVAEASKPGEETTSKQPVKTAILGSRNGLLLQTSDRVGAVHKSKLKDKSDYSKNSTISLCVDSLLNLRISDYFGGCLVIDEADSVIEHLIIGGTCKKQRTKLFFHLQALCRNIALSGGQIVIMDAGLKASTIKFFEELCEVDGVNFPKTLVQNNFDSEDNKWDIELYFGALNENGKLLVDDRTALYAGLEQEIKAGGVPYFCTDSKDEAEAVSEHLNQFIEDSGLKGSGFAITSITDKKLKDAFLKDPEQFCKENADSTKFVAASPTIESGTSIEGKHFTRVFALFYGMTSTTETQMQVLGRVRSNVPRTIFIADRVKANLDGETPNSSLHRFDADGLFHCKMRNFLEAAETNGVKQYLSYLEETNPEMDRIVKNKFKYVLKQIAPLLRKASELEAKNNYTRANQRRWLKEALKSKLKKGKDIKILDSDTAIPELKKAIATTKKVLRETEAERVKSAEIITIERAAKLSEAQENDIEIQRQIERAFLQDRLPNVELTADLVLKSTKENGGRWLRNTEKLVRVLEVETYLKNEAGTYFVEALDEESPMMRHNDLPTDSLVYTALRELGLPELIDSEKVWSNEELIEFLTRSLSRANRFLPYRANVSLGGLDRSGGKSKLAGNVFVNADNAFFWVNKLLATVGFEMVQEGFRYKLNTEDNFDNEQWLEVFEACKANLTTKSRKKLTHMQNQKDIAIKLTNRKPNICEDMDYKLIYR